MWNEAKKILKKNRIVNRMIIINKERLKSVSYGNENPDKTFFIIRRNAPDAGLFSFVITNIGWIKYAINHGYIPVVDMQYYYNTYITKENVGKVNAWDFYFKQPAGYCLNDISHSKKVIISSVNSANDNPSLEYLDRLFGWKNIVYENIFFSDSVKKEIDVKFDMLFREKRVLGVLCRGTDYISTKPHGHPVQPDPTAVIEKAKEMMDSNNCEKLFLATEDQNIYELFTASFGEKLLSLSTERYKNTGSRLLNYISENSELLVQNPSEEKYRKGFDYAVTIGLLSRCTCLVAGKTSGTLGALLLNKEYENVYLFDLGNYR